MARQFTVEKIYKQLYPATHTFWDEADDTSGTDIDFIDSVSLGAAGICKIYSDYQNHRKVLGFADDDGFSFADHNETQATSGVREFWICVPDNTLSSRIYFQEDATLCTHLRFVSAEIQDDDGAKLADLVNDTWVHIRLDWFADNTFDVYIDGSQVTDGQALDANQVSGINKLSFKGYSANTSKLLYFDAYGDPDNDTDYNIGDNAQWRFLKDDADTTSDFESEDWGESGTSIDFVDAAVVHDGEVVIDLGFDEHKKILRLQDDATAGQDPYFYHSETQATAGHRELFIKTNDVTEDWHIAWYDSTVPDYIVRLRITSSTLYYRDNADVYQSIQSVANDTWYHLIMKFYADNTFDIWVDGILKVDGVATNNNMSSGINRFYILCYGDSTDYIYLDAYGDITNDASYTSADNRCYEYKGETVEDITADIINAKTENKIYKWREGRLLSREDYSATTEFFRIYDHNSKLAMIAEIKSKEQEGEYRGYKLRDKNWDELNERLDQRYIDKEIVGVTDNQSMVWDSFPNMTHVDGDLLLDWANCDTDATTYKLKLKKYPKWRFLIDVCDMADSIIIIDPQGRMKLDNDLASGSSLDISVAADKAKFRAAPKVFDISETLNYYEIFGAIDHTTGTRFSKIIDNSGVDKKRKWRYVNNTLSTQTAVDNFATALSTRVTGIKQIVLELQGMGVHELGETFTLAYSDENITISSAAFYILAEKYNFKNGFSTLILSEGMIEESKFSAQYEKTADYVDSYGINSYYSWGPNVFSCYDEDDISDAISLIGTGYGIIRIHGTITLTSSIVVNGNGDIIIEGVNNGSVIDVGGDWDAIQITSAVRTTIRNLKIDISDITTDTNEAIDHDNGYLEVYNVFITGDSVNKDGYGITSATASTIIDNCDFVYLTQGIMVTANKAKIRNNVLTAIERSAIYSYSDYAVITGNIIDNANIDENTSNAGIYLSGSFAVTVTGNIITASEISGITIWTDSHNIVVSGNSIYNCDGNSANNYFGIKIQGDYNVINGNACYSINNAGAGTGYGIHITADGDENTVVGNACLACDTGYLDSGTNTTAGNNNTA